MSRAAEKLPALSTHLGPRFFFRTLRVGPECRWPFRSGPTFLQADTMCFRNKRVCLESCRVEGEHPSALLFADREYYERARISCPVKPLPGPLVSLLRGQGIVGQSLKNERHASRFILLFRGNER